MRNGFRETAVVSAAIMAVTLMASVAAQPGQAGRAPQPATGADAAREAARRVDSGTKLYKAKGCYECHVNDAQGGPQGPRLGPNPIPLPRFTIYVRNPTGDMPPFTEKVLSNQELADIYAFLQARPQPKPVNTIPLLAP